MRGWLSMIAAAGLAATALPAPASAQPLPPGSYQGQCRDIRIDGIFLSATCSAPGGVWGQSQINVVGCQGREIYVDRQGGLACNVNERPITRPPGEDGYPPPRPRPPVVRPPPPVWGPASITVFDRRGFRGRSETFRGEIANLDRTGLNDRIRSIQLGRRGGVWEVCSDAYFRGRCRVVDRDIADTRVIDLQDRISSIRRVR